MNHNALALIFSIGSMFLAWRYFTATKITRATVREVLSHAITIIVAIAVVFAGFALIVSTF